MHSVVRLKYNDSCEYVIYIFKASYIIFCNLRISKNVFAKNKTCRAFNTPVYIDMVICQLHLMYIMYICLYIMYI